MIIRAGEAERTVDLGGGAFKRDLPGDAYVAVSRRHGAFFDGEHDDTAGVENALDELITRYGGGRLIFPAGIPTLNFVLTEPGVTLEGAGNGRNVGEGAPSADYWKPFDPERPVVLIGDDTKIIEGSGVRNVRFYGDGTAQSGLVFGGGSVRCFGEGIHSAAFTQTAIGMIGGTAQISVQNLLHRFYAKATGIGAAALRLEDKLTTNAAIFSNDHIIADGAILGYLGGAAIDLDGTWAHLANIKIDLRTGGVFFRKTQASRLKAQLNCANVDFDATATDICVVSVGRNLWASSSGYLNPLSGSYRIDGRMMSSPAKTTGSISSGSPTLTVADASAAYDGAACVVMADGEAFPGRVKSASGPTVTLTTNAPRAATNADVYFGDLMSQPVGKGNAAPGLEGSRLVLSDANADGYGYPSQQPAIVGAAAVAGAPGVYAERGIIVEAADQPVSICANVYTNLTPTSVTQSGTTVTVTLNGSFGRTLVDDYVVVRGANEEGLNRTHRVATVDGSGNYLTFTVTNSASLTASGTIRVWVFREVLRVVGRDLLMRGLRTYASDAAAASGGIPVDGLYRNGSAVQVRVT